MLSNTVCVRGMLRVVNSKLYIFDMTLWSGNCISNSFTNYSKLFLSRFYCMIRTIHTVHIFNK